MNKEYAYLRASGLVSMLCHKLPAEVSWPGRLTRAIHIPCIPKHINYTLVVVIITTEPCRTSSDQDYCAMVSAILI